jgi:hypothetical protein
MNFFKYDKNITSITNELEDSAFFHSRPRPVVSPTPQPVIREPKPSKSEQRETLQQNASIPENQNASIPAKQQSSMPENKNAGNLEIQHNTTATGNNALPLHI